MQITTFICPKCSATTEIEVAVSDEPPRVVAVNGYVADFPSIEEAVEAITDRFDGEPYHKGVYLVIGEIPWWEWGLTIDSAMPKREPDADILYTPTTTDERRRKVVDLRVERVYRALHGWRRKSKAERRM